MTHALGCPQSARGLFLIAIEPSPLLKSRFGLLIAQRQNSNFTMIEQGLDRIAYDAAPTGDLLAQKCPRSPFHWPHGTATDVFGKSVRAAARVRHVAQMVDASSRMTHIGTRSKASCVFPFLPCWGSVIQSESARPISGSPPLILFLRCSDSLILFGPFGYLLR